MSSIAPADFAAESAAARQAADDEAARPRLLDVVTQKLRLLHCAKRTEEAYLGWIRHFILFRDKRHPRDMDGPEIEAFLTHLAVDGHVVASTQSQATRSPRTCSKRRPTSAPCRPCLAMPTSAPRWSPSQQVKNRRAVADWSGGKV